VSAVGTVGGGPGAVVTPGRRGRGGVRLPAWSVLVAGAVVALVLVAVLFPGLLTSTDPNGADPTDALARPGGHHLLGTDQLGRDVLARIIYGPGRPQFGDHDPALHPSLEGHPEAVRRALSAERLPGLPRPAPATGPARRGGSRLGGPESGQEPEVREWSQTSSSLLPRSRTYCSARHSRR
jgi:hypothetical protein